MKLIVSIFPLLVFPLLIAWDVVVSGANTLISTMRSKAETRPPPPIENDVVKVVQGKKNKG